jgi:hypothetical protein
LGERSARRPPAAHRAGEPLAEGDQRPFDDPVQPPREQERERQAGAEVAQLDGCATGGERRPDESERKRVGQVERVADAAGEPERAAAEDAAAARE